MTDYKAGEKILRIITNKSTSTTIQKQRVKYWLTRIEDLPAPHFSARTAKTSEESAGTIKEATLCCAAPLASPAATYKVICREKNKI